MPEQFSKGIRKGIKKGLLSALAMAVYLVSGSIYAQVLPDWSGVWAMLGGTIFDADTKTGEGGSTAPGVRENPPYNADWEAKYRANLAQRDAGTFPTRIPSVVSPPGFHAFSTCRTSMNLP